MTLPLRAAHVRRTQRSATPAPTPIARADSIVKARLAQQGNPAAGRGGRGGGRGGFGAAQTLQQQLTQLLLDERALGILRSGAGRLDVAAAVTPGKTRPA